MKFNPIDLLCRLIAIPSVSREESGTCQLIYDELCACGIQGNKFLNNVIAYQPNYSKEKPTLLLNSHHDTVKPNPQYSRNPFEATVEDGKIFGLGSNDAGASVVSLIGVFIDYYNVDLPFNLVLAISAEEEVMGENGMRALLKYFKRQGITIDMALVGEPTQMQPAIGERGLLVIDCISHGIAGHAARNEGINALYKALADIDILRNYRFEKSSDLLGDISMQITQIAAGTQHNVVPSECRWVIDVRTTDAYTNEQTVEIIKSLIGADAAPRSTRVRASAIPLDNPLVVAALKTGGEPFVSPTTSDMALMYDIPSLKMGPGLSSRSHSADEYVLESEITDAIEKYHIYINELSKLI